MAKTPKQEDKPTPATKPEPTKTTSENTSTTPAENTQPTTNPNATFKGRKNGNGSEGKGTATGSGQAGSPDGTQGAQGGSGKDLVPFFNEDGLGAIVNSSRGIIAAWKQEKYASFGAEHFEEASRAAVLDMAADIKSALENGK